MRTCETFCGDVTRPLSPGGLRIPLSRACVRYSDGRTLFAQGRGPLFPGNGIANGRKRYTICGKLWERQTSFLFCPLLSLSSSFSFPPFSASFSQTIWNREPRFPFPPLSHKWLLTEIKQHFLLLLILGGQIWALLIRGYGFLISL